MKQVVTVGEDGLTAWVRTADGAKYNLGTVSILQLVAKLCSDTRQIRSILADVASGKEAMLTVESGKLWELLVPKRRVWSRDSFMPSARGRASMSSLDELAKLDQHIEALNKAASKGVSSAKMQEGLKILANLVQKVSFGSPESVLDQAEIALATIQQLEAKGRQLQASKARKDIHSVTSRVAYLLTQDEDSTVEYQQLAKKIAAISDALSVSE